MKILIYTTHRTGSTSLANFLMFNLGYDYQRYTFFENRVDTLPDDIIIKLTPYEMRYDTIKNLFDKRIVLIREDYKSQSESRVYSEVYGKKFSSYTIPQSFLDEYKSDIENMHNMILSENSELSTLDDCLVLTYNQLYNSAEGIRLMESYLNVKFKFILENKRYRNMQQSLV